MSLLVLMYHRALPGRHGNAPEVLDAHFRHIAESHRNVLPGDPLTRGKLNVCLSFDDATFDFYSVVYPLLQRYDLRALLAVPPAFVRERVGFGSDRRLSLGTDEAFADPERGGFCTWPELEEMSRSGHVAIAAHGLTHRRLDRDDADLAAEIDRPRAVLGIRLGTQVDSFVFPYGRLSARSLTCAKDVYRHVFRIGGALNSRWGGLLYRVDADRMLDDRSVFAPARLLGYRARTFWNRLRLR